MIKKAALSLIVIGASGAYVWSQSATQSSDDLAEAPPATAQTLPDAVAAVVAEPPLIVREPANSGDDAATAPLPRLAPVKVRSVSIDAGAAVPSSVDGDTTTAAAAEVAPAPTSAPRPRITVAAVAKKHARLPGDVGVRPLKVSATIAAKPRKGLSDGTFDGPAIDAFYGLVQIEANVQNGKLASIKVLQYPSDRRTSIAINRRALPVLRSEAIAAQSANVDIVSGATLTSEAFIESLGAALREAST